MLRGRCGTVSPTEYERDTHTSPEAVAGIDSNCQYNAVSTVDVLRCVEHHH